MKEMSLNIVFDEDRKTGRFCAYFAEFPDIIAEGETKSKSEDNLWDLFLSVAAQQRAKSLLNSAGATTKQFLVTSV